MTRRLHATVCGVLLVLSANFTAALSTSEIMRPTVVLDVQVSPDGKLLAVLRREERDGVYIVRRADNKVVTGVNSSPGQRFNSVVWANNNRLLIEPALEVVQNGKPMPTGELLGFSLDGRNNGYLHRQRDSAEDHRQLEIVGLLPDDPEHVMVAEYSFANTQSENATHYVRREEKPSQTLTTLAYQGEARSLIKVSCECMPTSPPTLSRLNVYSGERTPIVTAESNDARFVVNDNGAKILYTGTENQQTRIGYSTGNGWSSVESFDNESGLGALPVAFGPADEVYALDNLVDTVGLNTLNLATGETTTLFRDQVSDIDGVLRGHAGNLLAVRYSPGYPSWFYTEPNSEFAKTHKALRAAFPEQDLEFVNFTSKNTEAVVRVYGDTEPGTYYIVNLQTKAYQSLFKTRPWLDRNQLVPHKPVEIQTRDQHAIHGYMATPRKVADEPTQLVVLIQDRPLSDKFDWQFDERVQMLTAAGFAVLQLNARGSVGYGRRHTAGTDEEMNRFLDRDVVDAVRWAATTETVVRNKACLFGEDVGAFTAMLTAARNANVIPCVVAANGVYSSQQIARQSRDIHAMLIGRQSTPWVNTTVTDRVDRYRSAILIVHDANSPRYPMQLAEEVFAALADAGRDVELLVVDDRPDDALEAMNRILDFLREKLATPDPGPDLTDTSPKPQLTQEQRRSLTPILEKITADVQRVTRKRDERNLPTGLTRRQQDPAAVMRRVRGAISGRDKAVWKILNEDQKPIYERMKEEYARSVEQALARGRTAGDFQLPGGG